MKNLFTIVILVIIGFLAYNHFNKSASPDDPFLSDIERNFSEASKLMTQSERTSAAAGVDMTASFEEGIERIKELRTELMDYIDELEDEKLREKASELKNRIEEFLDNQGASY